ncbi:hypothetical protein [Salipaludibacillus keqinensis]|uniref:hypothetical protein n=1 Tax=Salipaludibacillus keqinensis TaxID=2045207 RepID=UPI001304B684|nr:hypothetical protein [Salipaludibacillus keqinensis]
MGIPGFTKCIKCGQKAELVKQTAIIAGLYKCTNKACDYFIKPFQKLFRDE